MPQGNLAAFSGWNEKLAAVLAERDRGRVLALLVDAVGELLRFDSAQLCLMGKAVRPLDIYENVPENLHHANIDSYHAGAYLLDPFYRAGIERREAGVYRLADVAPPGFRSSQYYRQYYKECGNTDEVGSLTYLDDGLFLLASYTQFHGSPNFQQAQIERLRAAQPVIDRILLDYCSETRRGGSLHSELESALALFGNSVLTGREAEVIRLYLKGHSTRSVAERLNISQHTVSMHRKNAYAKLDIRSQFELFHLFIDSLSCFDPGAADDPLKGYLSPSA